MLLMDLLYSIFNTCCKSLILFDADLSYGELRIGIVIDNETSTRNGTMKHNYVNFTNWVLEYMYCVEQFFIYLWTYVPDQ